MKYFVYLARCNDNSLYTGSCTDIKTREIKHNKGEGTKYTKQRRPIKIVYFEKFDSLIEARRREVQIKRWTRTKKENLVKYGHPTKF
ncbi:MAG: GIY-YIG nuclease family protein [Patescibacteria group bacterium]